MEGTVRSDSAGIEIITSEASFPAKLSIGPEVKELGVGADAVLTIPMTAVPYDGGFAVSDAVERTVVIFNHAGIATRIGRDGDGPGEFRRPMHLTAGGDTLFVHDPSLVRITSFVGGKLKSVSSLPKEWFDADLLGRLPNGAFVLGRGGTTAAAPSLGVTRQQYTIALATLGSAEVQLDTLLILPGQEHLTAEDGKGGTLTMAAPYGRRAVATVWEGRVVIGLTDRHEVRVYDATGRLKRLIRLDGVREPMSRKLREKAEESLRSGFAQRSRTPGAPAAAMADAMLKRIIWPDSLPAFASIGADSAGNLWVGRFRTDRDRPERWDLFNREGAYIGYVDGLQHSSLMYVGRARVLLVSYDENDLPRLRIHELVR